MACLASEEQMPIYAELSGMEGRLLSPGGSALNSARAQKYINPSGKIAYFGCIGNDDFGKSLSDAVSAAGIDAKFSVSEEHKTGTCASVIVGQERSLCANIAAAKAYPTAHVGEHLVSLFLILSFDFEFYLRIHLGIIEKIQIPLHHRLLCRF